MAYHSDGFPSPNWSEAFGELPYRFLSRPLRLQLLCGGLGAAEHFLDQLGIPFLAAPYVDNARWLAPALQDRGTMLFTDTWQAAMRIQSCFSRGSQCDVFSC